MKKIMNLKNDTKKDNFLILFIIYIFHLLFMIPLHNDTIFTDNKIFEYVYLFRIHRWILSFPMIYYFIRTYKKYEYFRTIEKLNIKDFSIYFALSHYNVDMIIPAFFAGIIFSYVAYKYSIKYSIIIHFFINTITKTSQVIVILRNEMFLILFSLFSVFLIIFLLVFFIIGLLEGKYKKILSIFELSAEDTKNMIVFFKNNLIYLLMIAAIVVSNLVFNYKIV